MLGDIPVLGQLFRSTSFQKNESELMFIVTAQVVKPLNRDDVPQMRGVDGLKTGSPLGVEPKGEGIDGLSGHKVSGQNIESTPATTTTPEAPKASDPKVKTTETSTSSVSEAPKVNPVLPVAKSILPEAKPENLKP
jgi:pilus assembly protein CpaC